jgi:arylsulfatase A
VSNDVFCTTDLLATCADILGKKLLNNAGEDSSSMLSAMLGKDVSQNRKGIIHHAPKGQFAIRRGKWKYIVSSDGGKKGKTTITGQLYNMEADQGETTNIIDQHPEITKNLNTALRQMVANGRSTPGSKLENDTEVMVR